MADFDFRKAMRRLATTVHVVTCRYGKQRFGMTATAVLSVCNDPPAMLACVNSSSSLFKPLDAAEQFCINLLKQGQEDVALAFSGGLAGEQRFQIGEWSIMAGVPYLINAQASVFCQVRETVYFGTHGLFIGAVFNIITAEEVRPLLYQDGKFVQSADIIQLVSATG